MKKTLLYLIVAFCVTSVGWTQKQSKGRVVYEYVYTGNIEERLKENISDLRRQAVTRLHETYTALSGTTAELYFSETSSYFTQEKPMEDDSPIKKQNVYGFNDPIFISNEEKTLYSVTKFPRETALTSYSPNHYEWILTDETKEILGIPVRKATAIFNRIVPLEAWYAPSIPNCYGPTFFFGLPGMILEVHVNGRSSHNYKLIAREIKYSKRYQVKQKPDMKIITSRESDSIFRELINSRKQHR
ncbi:MAG: GLPGLI family protein [Capnocytophaga sp.]|nr:GLPGLI family protein [Capnocytophaga sp.]